jgi:hypothetical protein
MHVIFKIRKKIAQNMIIAHNFQQVMPPHDYQVTDFYVAFLLTIFPKTSSTTILYTEHAFTSPGPPFFRLAT